MSGNQSPPIGCRHKLVLVSDDRGHAQLITTALAELIEPPADAVSIFEVPEADPAVPAKYWRVDAYYIEQPDCNAIAAAVAALTANALPDLRYEEVPDENWVSLSQAALPPVVAGRFTVHGSHDSSRIPRGPLALLVDAGEAFGTAHHATTLGCLLAIDRLTRRRQIRTVLDLGCGSGVLAIAAQRALPRARVVASDIDATAVTVARTNARLNGTTAIRAIVCDGLPGNTLSGSRGYDLVVANILARPLVGLAGQIARAVYPGGTVVLSGVLNNQAREVLGAYLARGFALISHSRIAGWSTLTLRKRQVRARGVRAESTTRPRLHSASPR